MASAFCPFSLRGSLKQSQGGFHSTHLHLTPPHTHVHHPVHTHTHRGIISDRREGGGVGGEIATTMKLINEVSKRWT